jgi:hypothetical protein
MWHEQEPENDRDPERNEEEPRRVASLTATREIVHPLNAIIKPWSSFAAISG